MTDRNPSNQQEWMEHIVERLGRLPEERRPEFSAFLAQQVIDAGAAASPEEANRVVQEITGTVDGIGASYRSLVDARARGESREEWLAAVVEQAAGPQQAGEVLVQTRSALARAAGATITDPTGEPATHEATPTDEIGFRALSSRIMEDVTIHTLGSGLASFVQLPLVPAETPGIAKVLEHALRTPFNSAAENDLKKAVAVATVIADRTGTAPLPEGTTPSVVAAAVSMGVAQAKAGYQVGTDASDLPEALDFLLDTAAAALGSVVRKACEQGGAHLGQTVGQMLGAHFGPGAAKVGAEVGRQVGSALGRGVGEVVGCSSPG